MKPKSKILIIAGSDSSGGAGIQADIKTVTSLGSYAMTAVTAITSQNTTGVSSIISISPKEISKQIEFTSIDIKPDAIKIGMLHSEGIINAVLKTWPSGGPMIGFEGNPCGARDFLLVMIEKLGEGGGEEVVPSKKDVNDCQWYTRRKPLEGAQDINLGALLAGDGLTIDLVYDMKEFEKYNPGETFDDFTQVGHYISIGDVKGFGSQEAQRDASGGPDAHSGMVFSADAYYYNCETRELLIDTSISPVSISLLIVSFDLFKTVPCIFITVSSWTFSSWENFEFSWSIMHWVTP